MIENIVLFNRTVLRLYTVLQKLISNNIYENQTKYSSNIKKIAIYSILKITYNYYLFLK